MQRIWHILAKAGPYVLLELFMPGGTLMAVALYLFRRKHAQNGENAPCAAC
jgi:hypothetical protein